MKKTVSVILALIMMLGVFGCVAFAGDAYSRPVSISVAADSADKLLIIPVLRAADGTPVVDEEGKYIVYNPASKQTVTADCIANINGVPTFDTKGYYAAAQDKALAAQEILNLDFFEIPGYGNCVFYNKTVAESGDGVTVTLNRILDPYIPYVNYAPEGGEFMFALMATGSFAFDQTVIIKAYPTSYTADIIKDRNVGVKISPDEKGFYTLTNIQEDTLIMSYNLQDESLAGIKDFLFNLGNFFLRIIRWFFGIKA